MKIQDGLKKYSDGKWGISLFIPAKFSLTGKRTRFQRKIGLKTEAKLERDRIRLGWKNGFPAHIQSSPKKSVNLSLKLEDIVDEWIKIRGDRPREISYGKEVKTFFKNFKPKQISRSMILAYRKQLLKILSPSTVNKRLGFLRGVLSLAEEKEAIETSPFSKGRSLILSEKKSERHAYLSLEEEKKMVFELGEYGTWATFAIQTGIRQGEQLSLTWSNFYEDKRQIHLTETKNGRQRFVPLSDLAFEIIKSIKKTSDYIFPSPSGEKFDSSNFNHRIWRPAFNRAGLKHFRWHDLRHTCASRLIQAGVPLFTVGQILGHTTPEMTKRYAHLSEEHLASAINKISQPFPLD